MKTIYHVYVAIAGEWDFFFNGRGRLLAYWEHSDAKYRSEYMDGLFKKLGYRIKSESYWNSKFRLKVKEVLKEHGAVEDNYGFIS